MLVRVTEEHIRKGHPRSSYSCAVALAISELFPGSYVDVTQWRVAVYPRGLSPDLALYYTPRRFDLSQDAVRFVQAFDRGDKVEPLSFALGDAY